MRWHSLHRVTPTTWGDDPANWSAEQPSPGSVTFSAGVVARHIFYNESSYDTGGPTGDDNAIATDKVALQPGNTASFANYTSYDRGINGIMVDMIGVPDDVTPSTDNFEFHVGNDGDPARWGEAPLPSTVAFERGAGVNGSDRVTLIWNANEINNTWLQVTVLPVGLGLNSGDVFYFGNAVAEAGNSDDAQVDAVDLLLARNNPHNFTAPASITFPYDYNRDTYVDAVDVLLARNNRTSFLNELKLIDLSSMAAEAQGAPLGELVWLSEFAAVAESESAAESVTESKSSVAAESPAVSPIELAWLLDLESTSSTGRQSPSASAVDRLLATLEE